MITEDAGKGKKGKEAKDQTGPKTNTKIRSKTMHIKQNTKLEV